MAWAFDTLGYSRKLRSGGFTQDQAETAADAVRDFVMAELVTKTDLMGETSALRRDLEATTATLRQEMVALRHDLELQIRNLELRLTLRMGAMLVAAIGVLTAIIKLT